MTQKDQRCIIPGCPSNGHAKGYCRRHYGQLWRRGMIYEGDGRCAQSARQEQTTPEGLLAAERVLHKARQTYDLAVGLEGRMYWRRRITEAQESIRFLQEKATAAGVSVRG